jgi:hypothetical protein
LRESLGRLSLTELTIKVEALEGEKLGIHAY